MAGVIDTLLDSGIDARVDPVAIDSMAIDPVAIDPVAIDPVAIDPAAIDPVAIDPVAVVRRNLEDRLSDTQALLAGDGDCIGDAVILARQVVASLQAGGKVLFFGNGGSSMDAGHLAAELLGRFNYDRPSLPAVSLPDSTAAITAIGNDYGYDQVFARQLRGLAKPGDVAIGLTTSGNSANVVLAFEAARELGVYTAALTGEAGGRVAETADLCIRVPSSSTPRIQEMCLHLAHTVCEIVESSLFPRD
jgi:D-sedoheptulose 7-phosphate isomerase